MKTKSLLVALGILSTLGSSLRGEAAPTWRNDVADAFAEARATSKPLLVDLYADWCGWCKVMEQRVFPTAEFRDLAAGLVLLRVDVEDRGQGTELAARYDSSSLPTLLLLEPSGALVGAVQGFLEAPELVARLAAERAVHERRVASFSSALAADDPQRLELAALDFYRRNDGPRAAALFARLLAVASPAGEQLAWARYFLADALRQARRFDEARREAERARREAAGSDDAILAERLALLPFWISRDAERCADASRVLGRFESEHPTSAFLPGARNAFERLRQSAETCS
ncbi:MAG TPA: thioredoxin family protein [Thermoanaerobaculia bacterium]